MNQQWQFIKELEINLFNRNISRFYFFSEPLHFVDNKMQVNYVQWTSRKYFYRNCVQIIIKNQK